MALVQAPTRNARLLAWVDEMVELCQPDDVHWFDGSDAEHDAPVQAAGRRRHLHRARPRQAARLLLGALRPERRRPGRGPHLHLLGDEADAGPTNNWKDPAEMRGNARRLFRGSHAGPHHVRGARSAWARSARRSPTSASRSPTRPYVAVSMRTMTRAGQAALDVLGADGEFVPVRALGRRAARRRRGRRRRGRATPTRSGSCTSPRRARSGRTARATAATRCSGKKCFALRIASVIARDEGWLAEHMLILKITSPEGRGQATSPPRSRRRAARPTSPCSSRPIPGWKVETIGDDIAWMKFGAEGRLHAINPEFGFFGVAPGHQRATPTRTRCTPWTRNTVFTNTALTDDGDVWWEGMTDEPPAHLTDWKGHDVDARVRHARPRTRTRASACRRRSARSIAPEWEDPKGVPISAFLFGGRRATTVPLVFESRDWQHGVFVAATMGSEKTAAASGGLGELRHDPFAMLPFCGYNMGDYFAHWLSMTRPHRRGDAARDLRRELVPQGRRRQVPVARLRRELARARVDLPAPRRRRPAATTPPSVWCPRPTTSTSTGLDMPADDIAAALAVDDAAVEAPSSPASASTSRASATACRASSSSSSTRSRRRLG